MGKTIRSFNADDDVNTHISESNIKKGELSTWINDKIKKGIIYEKNPQEIIKEAKELTNLEVEI